MRETYSTIRHLLHLATELDRACALFLSTHVSITHDEARVLLELGARLSNRCAPARLQSS